MKILVLHLSDLHAQKGSISLRDKIPAINGVVNQLAPGVSKCFIVISGDVSFNGSSDEYKFVFDHLTALKHEIQSTKQFETVEFIVVAGNHDVDGRMNNEARKTLIKSIQDNTTEADQSVIKILTESQAQFFDFCCRICPQPAINSSGLYEQFAFDCEGTTVVFNCFNTAWMSTIPEGAGKLKFPISRIKLKNWPENAILISVLHHPYNWFSSEDARALRKFLLANSNFVLTGHEHEMETYQIKDVKGTVCEYVEGGILNQEGSDECSFNAIIIDLGTGKNQIIQYIWNQRNYHLIFRSEWNVIQKRYSDLSFVINQRYINILNSTDYNFKHPRKDHLLLSDIYVNPDLERASKDRRSYSELGITDLRKLLLDEKHVLVVGAQQLGKTALLKRLFSDISSEQNYIPIIIDGTQIDKVDEQHVQLLIERTFVNCYDKEAFERFSQLPKSHKVLMVDDFDKSPLNPRGRNIVLKQLEGIFEYVLLTSTSLVDIEELVPNEGADLFQYERISLSEFGYYLRGKLIEKWLRLGNQFNVDEAELQEKLKHLEHEINSVIGNRVLPYNPFIILTLLQAVDLNYDISTATGAYGYYYEILIKQAISRTSRSTRDVGIKVGFLSCLAYYMFAGLKQQINSTEMTRFCIDVYQTYSSLTVDSNRIVGDLVNSGVLALNADNYSFAHPYEYQYFIALFLADNMKNPNKELREQIEHAIFRLCTNLHKENYANIVMFLSYLSKDPIVLDLLTANADRLFADVTPCNLNKDVDFINRLDVHKLVTSFSNIPAEQSREAVLRSQDRAEHLDPKNMIKQGEVQKIDDLEEIPSIAYSFALINILGQILRNYLGTMDSEHKQKIVDSSYRLGLRVLERIFLNLQDSLPDLRQDFGESMHVKEKHLTESEINMRFANYIFATSILMSLLMVRNVTLAVGAPELELIYEQIRRELDITSVSLLNLSIQLEHYKGHPVAKVIEIHKALKKNQFSSELVRQLTILNMYLYSWPVTDRQKVLSEFGFQKSQNAPKFLLPKGKLIKKAERK